MIFTETRLKGAFIVDPERREDVRGFFTRVFCRKEFAELGLDADMAQVNTAMNVKRGTVRGMHFQAASAPEAKLVRCTQGAILDVIVDLRPESATYLEHVSVELNAASQRSLYVPARFAHGYQTLHDATAILYQASAEYVPGAEGGLRYDDPRLAIAWPLLPKAVSSKDRGYGLLDSVEADLRARMSVSWLERAAAACAIAV